MINETANNIKQRISKLAIISVSFGVLGILVSLFEGIIFRPRMYEISGFGISGFFEIIGLVLSVLAFIRIKKSKGKLKGTKHTISGIFLMGMLSVFWWIETSRKRSTVSRVSCQSNLLRTGKAMLIYANDYDNEYPTPEKWCDLLL